MMLNKILNIFKPRTSEKEEKPTSNGRKTEESKYQNADSAVLLENQLIKDIVKALNPFRDSKREIRSLVLYVSGNVQDAALDILLSDKVFEENLKVELENKGIEEAANAKWTYKPQKPSENERVIILDQGIFLSVSNDSEKLQGKIKITAINGELEEDEYIFDVGFEGRLNIGRGKNPTLDTGRIHQNKITIKDDMEDTHPNRFVSRAHAYITQVSGELVLWVYEGGCYITENRTRIFRENEPTIDLTNTIIPYPLKDQDHIELGKNVVLLIEFLP